MYWDKYDSINSTGLANHGYRYYTSYLRSRSEEQRSKKECVISVSDMPGCEIVLGSLPSDTTLELNVSCPNVKGHKPGRKDSVEKLLRIIKDEVELKTFGLKLPPYFYDSEIGEMCDLLRPFSPNFVTCCNSIPNGLFIDVESERSKIVPNKGMGGTGGRCFLPIALSNVYRFRQNLSGATHVIGCGGVTGGEDVFKHILCGADAVQIGSAFLREGPDIFRRCTDELREIMKKKKYTDFNCFHSSILHSHL